MRAAIWFLLPSDGTFLRDSSSLHYYLPRQGWRAVLRRSDVTGRPWKITLTASPTPLPLLPEITASNSHQRDQKKKKRIVPLHLIYPGYPGRYDPGGESGRIRSSIFQGPMRICLELTSDPGG